MILRSRLLAGIPHGFSTRQGGVSVGPFAASNVARNVGDEPVAVEENRRRLIAEIGEGLAFVEVDQVHGARVVDADRAGSLGIEADGVATEVPGLAVAVRTADCAPILMAARDASGGVRAVAAVHAGWRGAVAGIAEVAARGLAMHGAKVVAAIGPCIGVAAFEVGDEVVEAARASLDGAEPPIARGPTGRWHLDLRALIEAHLVRAGLRESDVEQVGGCTFTDAELYFSHRRDHGRTGRHLSAIALPGAAVSR